MLHRHHPSWLPRSLARSETSEQRRGKLQVKQRGKGREVFTNRERKRVKEGERERENIETKYTEERRGKEGIEKSLGLSTHPEQPKKAQRRWKRSQYSWPRRAA